jgi:hypothetical protein
MRQNKKEEEVDTCGLLKSTGCRLPDPKFWEIWEKNVVIALNLTMMFKNWMVELVEWMEKVSGLITSTAAVLGNQIPCSDPC